MEELKDKDSFFDKIPFMLKLSLAVFAVMVLFALLLSTDIAVRPNEKANLLTGAYTAVSAFTLCGSSVVTSSYWSGFGMGVILLCMQLGAFTVMILSNALFLRVGSFIDIKFLKFNTVLTVNTPSEIKKFIKYIILYVLFIESVGFILYLFVYVPAYGLKGVWLSLFYAVSAFSNCGMSALSLGERFVFDYNVLYNVVSFILMFAGSWGFMVICDILSSKKWEKFSFNTKFTLLSYISLTLLFALSIFLCEKNNPESLGNMPIYTKVFSSLNLTQAVHSSEMTRFVYSSFTFASKALIMLMMFVGSMPSSFIGGVKTNAIAICLVFMFKYPFGIYNKNIGLYRIEQKTFEKALFIVMSLFVWVIISSIILCSIENIDYFTALFETLSTSSLSGITITDISSFKASSLILMMINMLYARFAMMLLIYVSDTNRLKYTDSVEKISRVSYLNV